MVLLIATMFLLRTDAWSHCLIGFSAVYWRGGEFQPQIGLLHKRERPYGRPSRKQEGCFMPLVQIVLVLIVVGILLGLINRYIPMAGSIKSILNAVVIIAVVLWLLNVFGLFKSISAIKVGSLSWLGAVGV